MNSQEFLQTIQGTPLENIVSSLSPPAIRGVDILGLSFDMAYRNAQQNFESFHNRPPDPQTLPLAADHLYFSKFLRFFPTDPNPASKLDAAKYLDTSRFGESVYIPKRIVFTDTLDLQSVSKSIMGTWCKLDLGNSGHIRVLPRNLAQILPRLHWQTQTRYGLRWGEWWYGLSRQRVFFEEDLTDRMTGDEYQFHINRGRCHIVRKRHLTKDRDGKDIRKEDCYFDEHLAHIPGTTSNHTAFADRSISPYIDVMKQAALQIGERFDYIRVDFIELRDRPALGELSPCTMNARVRYSTDELETAMKAAVALV